MGFMSSLFLLVSVIGIIFVQQASSFSLPPQLLLNEGRLTSRGLALSSSSSHLHPRRLRRSVCRAFRDETETATTQTPKRFFPVVKPTDRKNIMGDQVDFLSTSSTKDEPYVTNSRDGMSPELLFAGAIAAAVTTIGGMTLAHGNDIGYVNHR